MNLFSVLLAKSIADDSKSGETFEVNLSYNSDEQGSIITTKTFQEIKAAYESGMEIIGKFTVIDSVGKEIAFNCAGYHTMTFDEHDGILLTYFPVIDSDGTEDATIVMLDNNTVAVIIGEGFIRPITLAS